MKNLIWLFLDRFALLALTTISTFWYAILMGAADYGRSIVVISIFQVLITIYSSIQQSPLLARGKTTQVSADIYSSSSAVGWFFISFLTALLVLYFIWLWGGGDLLVLSLLPAMILPLSAVAKVYLTELLRDENFKAVTTRSVLARIIAVMTGLFLAFKGFPAWAVIVQWSLEPVIGFVVMRVSTAFRIKFVFDRSVFCSMVREGAPNSLKVFSQEMKSRGLIILLAVFVSEASSAYYSLASKFVEFIRMFFVSVFVNYSLPKFVRYREDNESLWDAYRSLSALSLSVLLPGYVGFAFLSNVIVNIFFGAEWVGVVWMVWGLAGAEILLAFVFLIQPLQIAILEAHKTLVIDTISAVVMFVIFVGLVVVIGDRAAIVSVISSTCITIPFYVARLMAIFSVSISGFFRSFLAPTFATLLMLAVLQWMSYPNTLYEMVVVVICAVFVYAAVMMAAFKCNAAEWRVYKKAFRL